MIEHPHLKVALSNVTPNSRATIRFDNPNRASLLVIGGEKDVIMPASLSRKIYNRHRASPVTTEYKEFAGRIHFIIGETGWEEVADYALSWAESHLQPAVQSVPSAA